jgi:hypothetical protein
MFASLNKEQILLDFDNARDACLIRIRHTACEGAQKHLHRGFLVRVSMMEESIVELDKELQAANAP